MTLEELLAAAGQRKVGADDYAGEITPQECWEALQQFPQARLVDVRTAPEWTAGEPDLSAVGQDTHRVSWKLSPGYEQNPHFLSELESTLSTQGSPQDTPIFFLCRGGSRSREAAMAATAAGYRYAFNVTNGFEGGRDAEGSRADGWVSCGLPFTSSIRRQA